MLPVGRRAECADCHAELHVCRMCRHYDTAKAKQCREPVADPPLDKCRANFCDWFQLAVPGGPPSTDKPASGRAALEALFDDPSDEGAARPTNRQALDDLFKS